MRTLAAAALTAAAKLPVDAHPTAGRDHSLAFAIATATGRSLNEYVGLTVSSLIQSSREPIASSRFLARRNGVWPAARSTIPRSSDTGRSSRYRHNVSGRPPKEPRWNAPRTASISYRTSSGPKHDSHITSWIGGYSFRHSRHCKPRTYPANDPPNFRCGRKGIPQLTLRATIIQIAIIEEFGLEIGDSDVARRGAEWTLRTARPRVVGELAHRAEVRDEHRIARPEQLGIQIRALAVDEGDHAPVAPAGLAIVLVHEGLRPDRAGPVREFLRLRIARLSDLRTVHEREPDPGGADVERIAVDDMGDGIRKAGRGSPTLRANHRGWVASGRIASR